jgi:[2Fe-2S] binding domain
VREAPWSQPFFVPVKPARLRSMSSSEVRLSGVGCIKEGHAGSPSEIREWMSGNICRCGAYTNIVTAVSRRRGAGRPVFPFTFTKATDERSALAPASGGARYIAGGITLIDLMRETCGLVHWCECPSWRHPWVSAAPRTGIELGGDLAGH